ncbi:MAG: hypothetical protein ABJ036_22050 [Roseibium sp.]
MQRPPSGGRSFLSLVRAPDAGAFCPIPAWFRQAATMAGVDPGGKIVIQR